MTTLRDPERLSYVNKDVAAVDADLARYISAFIPTIKGMTAANEGRMIFRLLAAVLDMLNFSVDMQQRESNIVDAMQLKNLLRVVKLIGYGKEGASGAACDCTFSMATGVAPPGGTAIPLWTTLQKSASPVLGFVTTAAATIPAGLSSIAGVGVIQGTVVTGEVLTAAASGDPWQSYQLAKTDAVEAQIQVSVGGVLWTQVEDLWESGPADLHYTVVYDEINTATILFGDGEFGRIPAAGAAVTASYVWTLGAGNAVGAGQIDTVLGALAGTVTVTNPIGSTGGLDGDSVEDVRVKAPGAYRAQDRAVNGEDVETLAKNVSGVYSAKLSSVIGNTLNIYVLPTGGGTAPVSMLDAVEAYLTEKSVLQGNVVAYSVFAARVRIKAHVTAYSSRISKSVLLQWARDAITAAFVYDQFAVGEGYTVSQVGQILLGYQNGSIFRSVDFEILSRWPRVVQSNLAAPAVQGDIYVSATAGYETWALTADSAATFQVTKEGVFQALSGTVGVPYVSPLGEVNLTLGVPTDVLSPGDTWTFQTSKLAGNLLVGPEEHMSLAPSDLVIEIHYPGEYSGTSV